MRLNKLDTTREANPKSGALSGGRSSSTTTGDRPAGTSNQPSSRGGVNAETVGKHVERLNATLRTFDKRFAFRVHEGTNRVIVTVLDVETGEILREIPPEKILDIVASIDEMVGIIIDERI